MNLMKAELLRFASRRFIQIMMVGLLVALGLTVFTVVASSERPSEAMWEQARIQAAEQRVYLEREYSNCIKAVSDARHCEELNPKRAVPENYLYGVFHFGKQIKPLLYFLAAFLSLFGYLVMASFIGSELHSGGMTNLLLWRPSRMTVLGTKLGVGLGMVTAISVIYTLVYVGVFWGLASVTGYSGGVSALFWGEIGMVCLKALGMAAFFSVVAFTIAAIGRHTAAALGALLGYVIVWEGGARLMLEITSSYRVGEDPFFLSSYVGAWFAGEYRYYSFDFDFYDRMNSIYWWQSAVVFAVVAGVLVTAAFIGFRRRDLA